MTVSNRPLAVVLSVMFAVAGAFAAENAAYVSPAENEYKAYGELHGFICDRIRLWPDLAPP